MITNEKILMLTKLGASSFAILLSNSRKVFLVNKCFSAKMSFQSEIGRGTEQLDFRNELLYLQFEQNIHNFRIQDIDKLNT